MEFEYLVDGAVRKIVIEKTANAHLIRDGETSFTAEILPVSDNEIMILAAGRIHTVHIARDGERRFVSVGGREVVLREPGAEPASYKSEDKALDGGLHVRSPMPGKVIKVQVAEGENVRKNQTLAIVEAMKMENEITSAIEGRVKKIHVAAGELVDADKMLIELEPKT